MKQIDNNTFLAVGAIVFLLIGLLNGLNIIIYWNGYTIYTRTSSILGVLFNFLISYMLWSYRTVSTNQIPTDNSDIEETIKKLKESIKSPKEKNTLHKPTKSKRGFTSA